MHLETLGVFCDVADARSFGAAARKNGCTTASVSQSFSAVEDEFHVRCAVRDSLHFLLTSEGELCRRNFAVILQARRDLNRALERSNETSAQVFALAACFSFGLHQLQPVLKQFRQAFPRIQITVSYAHIDRVHQLVLENRVAIGLVAYPRHLPGLVVEMVRREPLRVICHPQHRFADWPVIPLAALRGLTIFAWTEMPWAAFLKKVPDSQRHLFEPRHSFNELKEIKQAVENDLGIAVLPAATVEWEVANHLLAAVPFADGTHTEPLGIIYRKGRPLTPAIKDFIQALKQT